MHALEKAALDDPFLADALEGYAFTPTPAADLESLRVRLQQAGERRKVVPLFSRRSTWLRAAAVILVVAGGVWLITRPGPAGERSLAHEEMRQNAPAAAADTARPETSAGTTALSDSFSGTFGNTTITNTAPPALKQEASGNTLNFSTATAQTSAPVIHDTSISASDKALSSAFNASANQSLAGPATTANNSRMYNNNATVFNNVSPQANQVSAPPVLSREEAKKTWSRNQYDSVLDARGLDGRTADVKVSKDSVTHLDVVLKEQPSSVQEVVVTQGAYRKAPVRRDRMVLDSLEPAEGWARFDDYVAEHLKRPEDAPEKSFSGEVQLSFDVNSKGEPVNITVEKSLCDRCDEEAIRLLKEGPKWKKKKNRKGWVTIRF